MSHITQIATEVRDIEAVKALCKEMGWTFRENQMQYQWWGRWMGDTPLPEGVREEDLGKCDHAIQVPGTSWEIGLVKNKKTGGYKLAYDFFGSQGEPLQQAIGKDGGKFLQGYGIHKATLEARRRGYSVTRRTLPNGAVKLTVNV